MNTRTFRFAAAVVLAGALAILGLVFTGHHHYKVQPGGPNIPASQTAHHADPDSIVGDVRLAAKSIPNIGVESKDIAGYVETRWTRQVDVTFNLPTNNACAKAFTPRSPAGDGLAITLGPAEESNAGVPFSDGPASTVGLSFVPNGTTGCGLISPSFASNTPTYSSADQFPATPGLFLPGDNVTLELGYSKGGQVTWATVSDNTLSQHIHSEFPGAYNYVGGSVSAGFGPFTPKNAQAKLWAVKTAEVATYTGVNGSLGTFKAQPVDDTSDGTSAGVLYANPGSLWDAGQNFSVFGQ